MCHLFESDVSMWLCSGPLYQRPGRFLSSIRLVCEWCRCRGRYRMKMQTIHSSRIACHCWIMSTSRQPRWSIHRSSHRKISQTRKRCKKIPFEWHAAAMRSIHPVQLNTQIAPYQRTRPMEIVNYWVDWPNCSTNWPSTAKRGDLPFSCANDQSTIGELMS